VVVNIFSIFFLSVDFMVKRCISNLNALRNSSIHAIRHTCRHDNLYYDSVWWVILQTWRCNDNFCGVCVVLKTLVREWISAENMLQKMMSQRIMMVIGCMFEAGLFQTQFSIIRVKFLEAYRRLCWNLIKNVKYPETPCAARYTSFFFALWMTLFLEGGVCF